MKFFLKKRAFTFVELIVGIIISSIIFLVVFYFLTSAFSKLLVGSIKTYETSSLLDSMNDISDFIDNGYSNYEILSISGATVENTNSILYMKNIDKEKGAIIFAIIDENTYFVKKDYNYGKNILGYRILSKQEVLDVEADNSVASFKTFPNSNMYKGLIFKDFKPSLYNSGSLLNIDINFTTLDNSLFYGDSFGELPDDKLSINSYNLVY